MVKQNFIIAIICLAIQSCSSYKIDNFDQYKPVKVTSADLSEIKKSQQPAIAILPVDDTGEFSKKHEIGKMMSNVIETEIKQNKWAAFQDRGLLDKIKNEIIISEANSKPVNISTPIPADFIVNMKVNNAGGSSSSVINWAELINLLLNGKTSDSGIMQPAYTAFLNANMDIISMPDFKTIKSLNCDAKYSRSTGGVVQYDHSALQNAVNKCMDKFIPEIIKNIQLFSQIVEKRIFEDTAIFKIDIGSANGLKEGQVVKIKRFYEDGLSKDTGVKKAYISENIDENYAWIIIKDKKELAGIKVGDFAYVKIDYENKAPSWIVDAID